VLAAPLAFARVGSGFERQAAALRK
jgi:hypothetical protein